MELQHHGVKGMKWGVRRYRNYDGSYTKKGLARYDKASEKYDDAKSNRKSTKQAYKIGAATKSQYKRSVQSQKEAKHELDKSYDRLKMDKRADKGKDLYKRGKTITGNQQLLGISQAVVSAGSAFARRYILSIDNDKRKANAVSGGIFLAGTTANAIIAGKNYVQNRNLRAYYAH